VLIVLPSFPRPTFNFVESLLTLCRGGSLKRDERGKISRFNMSVCGLHLVAQMTGYGPFRPFAASGVEGEAEVDVACTKRRE
jgi:hypothetical protein